jgi:hypothetical protein
LSDINIKKNIKYQNQTQDNYYKNINNNNNQNNDSSSSNIYDDSYDYKTQYNFKKNKNKNKYKNLPKFCSGASSQDNSYSDINKEDEVYNTTTPIRVPLKNDEEHYHQNLTIKIQNREEENKPQIKYVDNTPEGCVVINNNNNLERKNIKKNLSIDNDEIKKIAGKLVQRNKNIEFPNLNKYKNKNDILKTNNDNNIERKNKFLNNNKTTYNNNLDINNINDYYDYYSNRNIICPACLLGICNSNRGYSPLLCGPHSKKYIHLFNGKNKRENSI